MDSKPTTLSSAINGRLGGEGAINFRPIRCNNSPRRGDEGNPGRNEWMLKGPKFMDRDGISLSNPLNRITS